MGFERLGTRESLIYCKSQHQNTLQVIFLNNFSCCLATRRVSLLGAVAQRGFDRSRTETMDFVSCLSTGWNAPKLSHFHRNYLQLAYSAWKESSESDQSDEGTPVWLNQSQAEKRRWCSATWKFGAFCSPLMPYGSGTKDSKQNACVALELYKYLWKTSWLALLQIFGAKDGISKSLASIESKFHVQIKANISAALGVRELSHLLRERVLQR